MVIALGVYSEGRKVPLGLSEGAMENAAACTALLSNLRTRAAHRPRYWS